MQRRWAGNRPLGSSLRIPFEELNFSILLLNSGKSGPSLERNDGNDHNKHDDNRNNTRISDFQIPPFTSARTIDIMVQGNDTAISGATQPLKGYSVPPETHR